MNGRKISQTLENPIDNKILDVCESLINICKQYQITPNNITYFRICLAFIVLYVLFTSCSIIFPIIGTGVFYFLDCLDGHLARSTNQVTIFGDYLDHYADIFFYIAIIGFMIIKDYPNKINIIILIIFLTYMAFVHLGLQQLHYKIVLYNKKNDNTNKQFNNQIDEIEYELLDGLNCLHNLEPENISWTRFFGTGTLYTVIMIIIYYIQSMCIN